VLSARQRILPGQPGDEAMQKSEEARHDAWLLRFLFVERIPKKTMSYVGSGVPTPNGC
jgi:hypothetical protein